jgi:hypothetical protein
MLSGGGGLVKRPHGLPVAADEGVEGGQFGGSIENVEIAARN